MGLLDELEAEQRQKPDPWSGAEDKLEEWMGIVPEGTMKSKPKKTEDPNEMKITLRLLHQATEVYKPQDFRSAVDYARALKLYAKRVPKGMAAGYEIVVELGKIYHKRRIAEPVPDRKTAFASPEFTLAFTQAIQEIMNYGS